MAKSQADSLLGIKPTDDGQFHQAIELKEAPKEYLKDSTDGKARNQP
jgi:hypothetical protein